VDAALFPPEFLRLLATVPGLVRRIRSGIAPGARASGVAGGAFLFRGHREYRAGDDLRRVDWGVYARTGRVMVREYEAERDVRTEVWIDGSASLGPFGGWRALARAAAIACAVGMAGGGPYRLGVLRGADTETLLEADDPSGMRDALVALSGESPSGRLEAERVLPLLRAKVPPRTRWFLLSDLLTAAEPSVLDRFAGRGLSGALLHLRVPEVTAPEPGALIEARDAETGAARTVLLTVEVCARVVARAAAHAERWARHARRAGLAYLPFAPSTAPDELVRRLAFEVP
jgi:uncharacterized protein (DUF58 family)